MAASIRAQARVDSQRAYKRIAAEIDHEDPRVALPAAEKVLRLAGVSFASDAVETKDQAEAASSIKSIPTSELEAIASPKMDPLN